MDIVLVDKSGVVENLDLQDLRPTAIDLNNIPIADRTVIALPFELRKVTWLSKQWMSLDKRQAAVISIGDPGEDKPLFAVDPIDVLRLECHDIPDGIAIEDLDSTYVQFDWTMARKILQFEHRYKDVDIIVHCHAGISRSKAVALYLAKCCRRKLDTSKPCFYDGSYDGHNKHIYRTLEIAHCDLTLSGAQITPLDMLRR